MTVIDKIQTLEEKLTQVKGRPTEVFTRIVGYYRPVSNWNAGKASEYKCRTEFELA